MQTKPKRKIHILRNGARVSFCGKDKYLSSCVRNQTVKDVVKAASQTSTGAGPVVASLCKTCLRRSLLS